MHDSREAVEIADGRVPQFNGDLNPVIYHSDSLDGIT